MNNDTTGSIRYVARIDTSQLSNDGKKADDIVEGVASSGEKSFLKMGAAIGAVSGVVQSLFTRAIDSVSGSLGTAIKRVDTLNNSGRVFESLGFRAEDSSKAMSDLDKSIRGLPTSLDSAVRGMTMLAGATNDIGKSQKLFSAINNAVLGFGGTAQDTEAVVIQLSEAFAGGRVDAGAFTSLIENGLGPALNALAKSMGITTQELRDGLSKGTISAESFQDALIKMNEQGGGGLASFQDLSKNATAGISTGWENAQTAIARGIAGIIKAVGSENISSTVTNIGKAFEGAFKQIAVFVDFVQRNSQVFAPIAVSLATIVTLVTAYTTAVKIATIAQAAFNVVMAANPIGLIILAIAGLVAGLTYFFTQTEIGKQIIGGFFSFISNAAMTVWDWFKNNWQTILMFITGPIGIAVGMILRNFDTIKNAVMSVKNWITGAFSTIAELGTSIIKGAVNSVLGFAERTINGFINMINGALNAINKIPGVSIGKINTLSVPKLAEGGIVQARPGGILANIGEGGQDEAVIPLDKLEKMGFGGGGNGNVTINMNGVMTSSRADLRVVAADLKKALDEQINARNTSTNARLA